MAIDAGVRATLRAITPRPARVVYAAVKNYLRRLRGWTYVATNIRGVSEADRQTIRKAVFASPARSLWNIGRWIEPRLDSDAVVRVEGLGTFSVRGGTDDLGHVMAVNHEPIFRIIRELVREGDTVIDAGANIGGITIRLANTVGPKGRVLAVEMIPETAAALRNNISLNGLDNVQVIERAISTRAGERIEVSIPGTFFGMASITPHPAADPVRRRSVETTTLDELVGDIPRIALMKMDLEGAEPMALEGARRSIDRIEAIIYECVYEPRTASKILAGHGFHIMQVDSNNLLARHR
jgi:FkbM family methyltransferase